MLSTGAVLLEEAVPTGDAHYGPDAFATSEQRVAHRLGDGLSFGAGCDDGLGESLWFRNMDGKEGAALSYPLPRGKCCWAESQGQDAAHSQRLGSL